jgi:hypothetical protein
MDIVQLAFMLGPLLGAAAGYLVDGGTGATSGLAIPLGPLVVACCSGTGDMRYDRYGRLDRPSPQAKRLERVRLPRGRSAMRSLRRAVAKVDRASR